MTPRRSAISAERRNSATSAVTAVRFLIRVSARIAGVKVGQKPQTCPKCGNEYYTNACPNCGYNGSVQNAHQTTTAFQTSPAANSFNNNRHNKSKTSIGTILLWIFSCRSWLSQPYGNQKSWIRNGKSY